MGRYPIERPVALHTRLLRLLLSHIGMFTLVALLTNLGSWIFMQLERPYEDGVFLRKKLKLKDLKDSEDYFVNYCWYLKGQNDTYEAWNLKMRNQLLVLQNFALDMANTFGYDGTEGNLTYNWNYPNSLLFTVSIMTTIGYGHIAPKTNCGQLFTIMYAMIATPLLLVFLTNIGDGMAKVFIFTYSRICCRWCRSARYKQERKPGKRAKRVSEDPVGEEEYMPTAKVSVPVIVNLVIIGLYLGMGASIFSIWENWEISSAYYFSFVTLSTIGFGDMVPGNSFVDNTDSHSFTKTVKMLITIAYCLVGMALISMCIQMMQDQITKKVRWTGQELGLIKDESRPQLQLRRTRRGTAPETRYLEDSFDDVQRQQSQRREETAKRRQQRQQQQQPEDSDEDLFNLA